ncbi:MAG TPA: DUF192 domain-containing protein [Oscillospiraceae bacterium]|nr:DUF192 domain-containing protein [Oscillospiraceae bacterium]
MLLRTRDQTLIAQHVYSATTFLRRLRGLMFSKCFPQGYDALLLSPCNAVHTMFMHYTIDVVFLDQAWQVVAIQPFMQPWQLSAIVKKADHVLELPAGTINRLKLTPGDYLAELPAK